MLVPVWMAVHSCVPFLVSDHAPRGAVDGSLVHIMCVVCGLVGTAVMDTIPSSSLLMMAGSLGHITCIICAAS
jgi:hypothetical protein